MHSSRTAFARHTCTKGKQYCKTLHHKNKPQLPPIQCVCVFARAVCCAKLCAYLEEEYIDGQPFLVRWPEHTQSNVDEREIADLQVHG